MVQHATLINRQSYLWLSAQSWQYVDHRLATLSGCIFCVTWENLLELLLCPVHKCQGQTAVPLRRRQWALMAAC